MSSRIRVHRDPSIGPRSDVAESDRQVVRLALAEAKRLGQNVVEPYHIVLALVRDEAESTTETDGFTIDDLHDARRAVLSGLATS